MIKQNAQIIITDRAASLKAHFDTAVAYALKAASDYANASESYSAAADRLDKIYGTCSLRALKRTIESDADKMREYEEAYAACNNARALMERASIIRDAARASAVQTARAYVAECLDANAATLDGECPRYKRTEDYIRRMCEPVGSGYIVDEYSKRININVQFAGMYDTESDSIYLHHDDDALVYDGYKPYSESFAAGATPEAIRGAADHIEEARRIAREAQDAYDRAMDKIDVMLSALNYVAKQKIKEGQ